MSVPRTLAKGLSKLKEAAELRKLGGTHAERMARAAEQGYDTGRVLYHGGANDFDAFAESRRGVYLSDNPDIAGIYADNAQKRWPGQNNAEPNIIAGYVKGKPLVVSDQGAGGGGWLSDNMAKALNVSLDDVPTVNRAAFLNDEARRQGYGYVEIRDMDDLGGNQTQIRLLDNGNFRSVNADFNPEYRDSSNLLAGVAGAMPYAAGTAALLAGAAPEQAEAGPLQSLGRAAPYLTSAALGGAAALQSPDAEAGAVRLLREIDPARLIFRESMQNRLDSVREMFQAGDGYPPVTAVRTESGLEILDGHNRATVAKERGENISVVDIPAAEYEYLKNKGFDDTEISYGALTDVGDYDSASMLNQQFPGAGVAGRGDEVASMLMERGNADPRLLAGAAAATGAGMYAASDANAGPLNTLGRAAPYIASASLGAAMMTPEQAQANAQYLQDQHEARTAAETFAQMRGSKAGYWEARRQELLDMVNGLGDVANAVMPALDKPLQGYLGIAGVLGTLAGGGGFEQAIQAGARNASQPVEQTTYGYGGAVTDALAPYTTPEVAAAAGALVHGGIQIASPF